MKRYLAVILFIICSPIFIQTGSADRKKPVILVEKFREIGSTSIGDYSAGLACIVADDLRGLSSVEVITPELRKNALEEVAFMQLGGTKQMKEEALLLGADYIITGSYFIKDHDVTISIELIRVSNQTIIETAKVNGQLNKIQERADTALFILISLLEKKGLLSKTFSSEGIDAAEQKRTAGNNAFMYYSMASAKRYNDPKAALGLYRKAIISDPSYIDALIDAALVASTELSLHDTAIEFIGHAEDIIGKQGQKWSPQFAKFMTAKGEINMNIGKYPVAIDSFNASINMLKYIGRDESFEMSEVLNDIGLVMRKSGNYSEAFNAYNKSIEMKKLLGLEKTLPYAETLSNIAALNRYEKNFNDALSWNDRAKKLKETLGLKKTRTYALTISNEGIILCDKKDYLSGLKLFEQAISILDNIHLNNTDDYAGIVTNTGFTLSLINDYHKAIKYLRKAQSIRENNKNTKSYEYADSAICLAKCLSAIGNDCEALKEAKKGVVLKKKSGSVTDADINLSAELEGKCAKE